MDNIQFPPTREELEIFKFDVFCLFVCFFFKSNIYVFWAFFCFLFVCLFVFFKMAIPVLPPQVKKEHAITYQKSL